MQRVRAVGQPVRGRDRPVRRRIQQGLGRRRGAARLREIACSGKWPRALCLLAMTCSGVLLANRLVLAFTLGSCCLASNETCSAITEGDPPPPTVIEPKAPPTPDPCQGSCHWLFDRRPPEVNWNPATRFMPFNTPAPGFTFSSEESGPTGELLEVCIAGDLSVSNTGPSTCGTNPAVGPTWRPSSQTEGSQDVSFVFDAAGAGPNCTSQCATHTLTIVGLTEVHVCASAAGPCTCTGGPADPLAMASATASLELVGPQGPLGTIVSGNPQARTTGNSQHALCPSDHNLLSHYEGPALDAPGVVEPTGSGAVSWGGDYPFIAVVVAPCSSEGLSARIESWSAVSIFVYSQMQATAESYLTLLALEGQSTCCECGTPPDPNPGVLP